MSSIRRISLALFRLSVAAGAAYLVLPSKLWDEAEGITTASSAEWKKPDICYRLEGSAWTRFPVAAGQELLKLVTNALVDAGSLDSPDRPVEYSLEWELCDHGETPIASGTMHCSSHAARGSWEVVEAARPSQSAVCVCASRVSYLKTEGSLDEARLLRVRVAGDYDECHTVNVRVYRGDSPPAYKLRYMWQRLAKAEQRGLARWNVHGVDLLTEGERNNLLLNRWVIVPPMGVEGTDFHTHRIRRRKSARDGESTTDTPPERGLRTGLAGKGVIPLPGASACVLLELESISDDFPCESLDWRVADRRGVQVAAGTVRANEWGEAADEVACAGGEVMEVATDQEAYVRAFILEGNERREITPRSSWVGGFLVRAPIEFSFPSFAASEKQVRVDLRAVVERGARDGEPRASVRYEVLDEAGRILHSEALIVQAPPSEYEPAVAFGRSESLTRAVSKYARLSSTARTLRFYPGEGSIVVAAHSRPADRAMWLRAGWGDALHDRRSRAVRNWFALRPTRSRSPELAPVEVAVRRQTPGPLETVAGPDSAAEWAHPVPLDAALARDVLIPRTASTHGIDIFQDSVDRKRGYVELPRGADREIFVEDPALAAECSIQLGLWSPSLGRKDTAVLVDGRLAARTDWSGRFQSLAIGPIGAGWRTLRVEGSDQVRIFAESAVTEAGTGYARRRLYRVGESGLRFAVAKGSAGVELLAYGIAWDRASAPAQRLSIVIHARNRPMDTLLDSMTPGETILELWRRSDFPLQAWDGDAHALSGWDTGALTLGEDLAPGVYEVEVRQDPPAGAWFCLAERAAESMSAGNAAPRAVGR